VALKVAELRYRARMALKKRREKMARKLTNKEITLELQSAHQKIELIKKVMMNYMQAFDMYVRFKDDDIMFKAWIDKQTEAVKDVVKDAPEEEPVK
jgi:uncharacterized FlaG/YvyC family protein